MPVLQFKGKTAIECYHHTIPHHTLEFDGKLSVIGKGEKPGLDGNLIIEGDNLIGLKALLPTHAGQIKCIYIDPPYNTGNEGWVYNDNLTQPQFKEWIGQTVGKEGDDATRHDKWCCMMYPRLKLLKELLRDDGAIFISIDDNEVAPLRMLMDEIFNESNFVADITVVNNLKGRSDDKYIATAHEHLLVYRRSERYQTYGVPIPEEYQDEYTERDKNGEFYRLQGLRKRGAGSRRQDRPEMYYPFYYNEKSELLSLERSNKSDIKIHPKLSDMQDGRWRWGKETAQKRLEELVARRVEGRSEFDVFQVDYLLIGGDLKTIKPKSFWLSNLHSTDTATRIYKQIMGKVPYQNPKSPYFIMEVLRQATKGDELILDSFAGSGTTAHAALELNKEDGGNRKFILIQMPYDTKENEKEKFNICEKITTERVRRVIHGYTYTTQKGKKEKVAGLGGSFTYARVGNPLFGEYRDWGKQLPAYEELAKYIFYTETSRDFDRKVMNEKTGKIGEHHGTSYYLLYTPDGQQDRRLDMEWLRPLDKTEKNRNLVVYCEKLWVHRDDLAKFEQKTKRTVRPMIVPFNLKV